MTERHTTENQPGRVKKETTTISEPPQLAQPPKNPVGHPPKYKTAEALQAKIDEYFEVGVAMRKAIVGPANNRKIELIAVPTICGLVRYLGFADRHSFNRMERIRRFATTIKAARNRIEEIYETQLQSGNAPGAIFALKNFGWIDTPAIDNSRHYHIIYGYRTKPAHSPIRPEARASQLTQPNPSPHS